MAAGLADREQASCEQPIPSIGSVDDPKEFYRHQDHRKPVSVRIIPQRGEGSIRHDHGRAAGSSFRQSPPRGKPAASRLPPRPWNIPLFPASLAWLKNTPSSIPAPPPGERGRRDQSQGPTWHSHGGADPLDTNRRARPRRQPRTGASFGRDSGLPERAACHSRGGRRPLGRAFTLRCSPAPHPVRAESPGGPPGRDGLQCAADAVLQRRGGGCLAFARSQPSRHRVPELHGCWHATRGPSSVGDRSGHPARRVQDLVRPPIVPGFACDARSDSRAVLATEDGLDVPQAGQG